MMSSDKDKKNDFNRDSEALREYLILSLNDAASILVQIDPDDFSETATLKDLLNIICEHESCPESCREKISQASKIITDICDVKLAVSASARADMLAEVGRLIESAMNAAEQNGSAETHSRASLPAPCDGICGDETGRTEMSLPAELDLELIEAFISESNDMMMNMEEALLLLESDPDNMEAVNTVFRAFHNIKGTSGFFQLTRITEVAHHAESFLSRIRNREIRYGGGYADIALRSLDMLKELFQGLGLAVKGGTFFKPQGYDELVFMLADPKQAGISDEFSEPMPSSPEIEPVLKDEKEKRKISPHPVHQNDITVGEAKGGETQVPEKKDKPPVSENPPDTHPPDISDISYNYAISDRSDIQKEALSENRNADETFPETLLKSDMPASEESPKSGSKIAESSVRVPVERLDRFIDAVGELVVAHSMVAQDEIVTGGRYHDLSKKVNHSSKIVRELQNMSMSMRMMPLKPTFQKMARIVRDFARELSKSILFVTEGEETEIDRNMIDMINDPLLHIIRNAVDHGIEAPEVREKKGKPSSGLIKLSAYHSGGNVVIEVKDDGKGFDRNAVLSKAAERGFAGPGRTISEKQIENGTLTDREIFNLIFEPGFSAAEIVSDVSGRGVGMDVVKKNLEAIRGQIEIRSEFGKGSVFKMTLPLTLAIIDGMVVRVGTERYVMSTVSVVRSVRPEQKALSTVHHRGTVLNLQGRLIPLLRLAELFGIEGDTRDPTRAIVMIVEDEGRQVGLMVDELIGSQQIVIKTLGEMIRNIPGISGSAIMPDGKVGLILDVGGLAMLGNK